MSPTRPPLTITGDRYRWEFHHHQGSDLFGAVLRPVLRAADGIRFGDPVWSVTALYSWDLEVLCGFPLPASGHGYLRASDTRGAPHDPPPASPSPRPADSQPSRLDAVAFAVWTSSYGRWQHDDPVLRAWREHTVGIDIVGLAGPAPLPGTTMIGYRVWDAGRIVASRANLVVPTVAVRTDWAGQDPAVRAVVSAVTPDLPAPVAVQRAWMAEHGDWLAGLVEPPTAPYPPASRVAVDVGYYRPPATGRVVAAVHRADGELVGYRWTPDLFALPGHPYEDQPGREMFSRAGRVFPTLRPADTGVRSGSYTRWSFGFGGRVRAVDHPDVELGTVVRVDIGDPDRPRFQIQPDSGGAAVWLRSAEVAILAGCAWPTIDALREAREVAGVELLPGEVLIATGDLADVVRDGDQLVVGPPVPSRIPADPLFDPDSDQPEARVADLSRAPATASGLRLVNDHVGLFLLTPDDRAIPSPPAGYLAAWRVPADVLGELVGRHRPDLLPASGSAADAATRDLLAVVAAVHLGDELAPLLAPAAPPADGPPPPGL